MRRPPQSVGVAVITHRAKHHLRHCLPPVIASALRPRVLVVNSSSRDGTVEEARRLGAETLVIPRNEFNHGLTRERARKHLGTDIVVMMTPDAYPTDEHVLGKLVAPLLDGRASVAYARQVPHDNATPFERLSRTFNYPRSSHVRGAEDVGQWGIYTIFCSNACAAWSSAALDDIGGFAEALTNEDTFAVAKLLQRGHRIAYVAEAVVRHSHRYDLLQEFRRHFDTGLARNGSRELIAFAGRDEHRGWHYARKLLRVVGKTRPIMYPYAFAHLLAKWLGHKLGAACRNRPTWLKRTFSMQDYYWTSRPYLQKQDAGTQG